MWVIAPVQVSSASYTFLMCLLRAELRPLLLLQKYSLNSMIIFEPFQVIIEGFKSYKEQVATEPFSSKHNCVGKYAHLLTCLSQA